MASKRQKQALSKRDNEVFRKYGMGDFDDPHDYTTLDTFKERPRESLSEKPESIKLLERYGSRGPPLQEWYGAIVQPVGESYEDWARGLHQAPPEPTVVAVTAEQLSESDEDVALSSDEYDTRQPMRINWARFSTAQLDAMAPDSFYASKGESMAEFEVALSSLLGATKSTQKLDVVLRRVGFDSFALEDRVSVPQRCLRYYRAAYSGLFVALAGEPSGEECLRLTNYFYLNML